MSIAENYGALIATGEIDGFTYELRNPSYPMAYVYREEDGKLIGNQTQTGGATVDVVARMLIAELPKKIS